MVIISLIRTDISGANVHPPWTVKSLWRVLTIGFFTPNFLRFFTWRKTTIWLTCYKTGISVTLLYNQIRLKLSCFTHSPTGMHTLPRPFFIEGLKNWLFKSSLKDFIFLNCIITVRIIVKFWSNFFLNFHKTMILKCFIET